MRSLFPFDTNYSNQVNTKILSDFGGITDEAHKIHEVGEIVTANHRGGDKFLMSVYGEAFLLAERILETETFGKSEIKTEEPSLLLINTLRSLGENAMTLQQKIKTTWTKVDGYEKYKDSSLESKLYGDLRDFCYSMTDLMLIANELEKRFYREGVLLKKKTTFLVSFLKWISNHLLASILSGVVVGMILWYLHLN